MKNVNVKSEISVAVCNSFQYIILLNHERHSSHEEKKMDCLALSLKTCSLSGCCFAYCLKPISVSSIKTPLDRHWNFCLWYFRKVVKWLIQWLIIRTVFVSFYKSLSVHDICYWPYTSKIAILESIIIDFIKSCILTFDLIFIFLFQGFQLCLICICTLVW